MCPLLPVSILQPISSIYEHQLRLALLNYKGIPHALIVQALLQRGVEYDFSRPDPRKGNLWFCRRRSLCVSISSLNKQLLLKANTIILIIIHMFWLRIPVGRSLARSSLRDPAVGDGVSS
eukprot:Gregarina_sp_Poly_1__4038@NODE_2220_length_2468_cov_86_336943_g685_i1_p2_GENE_NODE_2220_length_2468_cov_86_336943_g685_i1NODE_2220_length_2468_cov_86_336943_g685_i1_p2_ORF_typecomplete_len120_score8_93_NODE_2220_length_2468_cov_86_336943_g685_i112211580